MKKEKNITGNMHCFSVNTLDFCFFCLFGEKIFKDMFRRRGEKISDRSYEVGLSFSGEVESALFGERFSDIVFGKMLKKYSSSFIHVINPISLEHADFAKKLTLERAIVLDNLKTILCKCVYDIADIIIKNDETIVRVFFTYAEHGNGKIKLPFIERILVNGEMFYSHDKLINQVLVYNRVMQLWPL